MRIYWYFGDQFLGRGVNSGPRVGFRLTRHGSGHIRSGYIGLFSLSGSSQVKSSYYRVGSKQLLVGTGSGQVWVGSHLVKVLSGWGQPGLGK